MTIMTAILLFIPPLLLLVVVLCAIATPLLAADQIVKCIVLWWTVSFIHVIHRIAQLLLHNTQNNRCVVLVDITATTT